MTIVSTTASEQPMTIDESLVEAFMADVDKNGLELVGPNGAMTELISKIMRRALEVELSDHLGYEKGDSVGRGSGNSRNGSYPKTALTDVGPIELDVPRDRNGSFEPKLIPKGQRRIENFNKLVCSLTAKGMSTRDVAAHIEEMYGASISPDLVSDITDAILPELQAWQNRPLDRIYPLIYLDAIVVKVRDNHSIINKACHIAMGVDVEGRKQVLGMWLTQNEGAKFWLGVLSELKNRGVEDVLIVCTDGLSGFPDAIEAVWPKATIQTCVVHLIRNCLKAVNHSDRGVIAKALRPIYTAASMEAAADGLDTFEIEWGDKYPAVVKLWRNNWERFVPFLAFDTEIRKVIYTTNAIESLNSQLRRAVKTKGHFPTDDAVLKIFYMTIRDIGDTRTGACGTGTPSWQRALNAFVIAFPDRLNL